MTWFPVGRRERWWPAKPRGVDRRRGLALGMTGVVDAGCFGEVLDGRDPWSGRSCASRPVSAAWPGYDLTFCAPKSVSLLHLLAPREMAAAVGTGHHAAVTEATDYLQRAAVGVRRTRGGTTAYLSSAGWWPVGSSTGPVGRSTPTSIPTWWWPTWPPPSMGGGRRWTAGGSSSMPEQPEPSTTPGCAWS